MTVAPDADGDVPEDHRSRRPSAHERSARAHRRAAGTHDEAADFFDSHDKPDKAAKHRGYAVIERQRAQESEDQADAQ